MTEPAFTIPPACPGCGRFLRTATEQARGRCTRCPLPAAPTPKSAARCCESDPPCADCPYQAQWSQQP